MGSGKGSSTQAQTGTSTYTPNPYIMNSGLQALGQAQTAAQAPFQLPTQQYAGFTPDQQAAFQQTRDVSQSAQPYYQQAGSLYNQSAGPISSDQIQHYMDPYANYVLANLKESQGQQMNDLTGRTTQLAGGVGADRIGVAQGELGRQQSLATGQTLSGIYGNALSAAQQDAARQQTAASGLGNLGNAAQTSGLQGASALYGMGLNQQGLAQNQLNAQYQNQLAQIAFPYQQAQYLAGITGGLAPAMGGMTTSGQNTTSTPAQPSLYSQLLGGAAGLGGLYGATNGFGGLFQNEAYGGNGVYGGSSSNPLPGLDASDYGPGFAGGGEVDDQAGDVPSGIPSWMASDPTIPTIKMQPAQVHQPEVKLAAPQQSSSSSGGGIGDILGSVAKIVPLFLAQGGTVGMSPYQGYADGGDVSDEDRLLGYELLRQGMGTRAPDSIPGGEPAPKLPSIITDGKATGLPGSEPYREPDQPEGNISPYQAWQQGADRDKALGFTAEQGQPKRISVDTPAARTGTPYAAFGGSEGAAAAAERNMRSMQGATYKSPYPDVDESTDTDARRMSRNPWLALAQAGFATMAGTSPFAGVNIGKGAEAGIKALGEQRKEDREDVSANQRAKQLSMQADKLLREYTTMTPVEAANIENQKAMRENAADKLEKDGWTKGGEDMLSGSSTWFNKYTGESGKLDNKTGQFTKFGPGGAGAPVAGSPAAATGAPEAAKAPPSPAAPAPYGVKELSPVTTAQKTDSIGYLGKGSPLTFGVQKDLAANIATQEKVNKSIPAMEHDISEMRRAFTTLTKDADKDGFLSQLALQPGATFGDRLEYAKKANALKLAAGEKPVFDPAKIAAAENMDKVQKKMGLTFSSQFSPREAMAGQLIGIEATPGRGNSVEGFKRVLSGIEALTEDTKAQNQFFHDFVAKNGHSMGWQAAYNAANPADKFVVRGLISTLPENLQKGLPQAVEQLRADPQKYKPIFDKYYNNTSDFFLRQEGAH